MPSSLLLGGGVGGPLHLLFHFLEFLPPRSSQDGLFLTILIQLKCFPHKEPFLQPFSPQQHSHHPPRLPIALCCITCPVFGRSTSCKLALPYSLAALLCYTILHESGGFAGLVSAICKGAPDRYSLNVC